MTMSTIINQIERAEARWKDTKNRRQEAGQEMKAIRKGGAVNWRRMDEPSRIVRRLDRLGERSAAEAIVNQDDAAFNPLERILGASQLTGIEFFERGLAAARAVARIEIRNPGGSLLGYGTGVLVSPRLLLTNNHVLGSAQSAAMSIAQFEYVTAAAGTALEPLPFRLDPGSFFVTSAALDFTLTAVEIQNANGVQITSRGWCPLIAGSGKAIVGERVNIIQHPGGERMQVTVRDNTILAVVEDFLQYEADTRPGSSGSPVFNEQWEMAALHHAGVPERDGDGRILMNSGARWTGRREDVDRISWIANEGVRISRIVDHVQGETLTPPQALLWKQAFQLPDIGNLWDLYRGVSTTPQQPVSPGGLVPEALPGTGPDGTASWLFRLSFGPVGGVVAQPGLAQMPPVAAGVVPGPTTVIVTPTAAGDAEQMAAELFERFQHTGPWYDGDADDAAALAYWAGVDLDAPSETLFPAIDRKLEETHTSRHGYSRARLEFLYPAIDLHEDGTLRNIYSGTVLDPREAMARELGFVLSRAEAMGLEAEGLSVDDLLERDDIWDAVELDALSREASTPFNCEHVVCQSWFEARQPMRADLHHLFACEPECNSFRSNIPYWQFPVEEEVVRQKCGRRENGKFEPEHGKGAVARATMYFLARYPKEIGNERGELTKSRIAMLLDWHRDNPVNSYERHRNWLTEKAQGNRNPFIDHPCIATGALLSLGFATA